MVDFHVKQMEKCNRINVCRNQQNGQKNQKKIGEFGDVHSKRTVPEMLLI